MIRAVSIALFVTLLAGVSLRLAAGMQVYDEAAVRDVLKGSPIFNRMHPLMAAQTQKLHAMEDSFLNGDSERIQQLANEIIKDMRSLAQDYEPPSGKEAPSWRAISGIALDAQKLIDEISNKDYLKAFIHYSDITNICLQCHQITRRWGTFSQPPPAQDTGLPADPAKTPAAPAGTTK